MISFFKKKNPKIFSPIAGRLTPLSEVNDPVFSEGMMGPGFAIEPEAGELYSPIEGVVTSIFPTKHAIGLKRKDGKELLIHIGIDTVELNGEGFNIFVHEAEKVTPQTKLAEIDLAYLQQQGKGKTIVVLFPEDTKTYSVAEKVVAAGEELSL
ncbi:PTS glucose transporter subunit IIA [Enterococcus gilvus]|uniref:PTS sugar transporter subunit IIA n=1 Tax=Enterococcus gilvus TaxID=160453 RepID=UPI00345EF235